MVCPICKKNITEENSVIEQGKEILSTMPLVEDKRYITYIERSMCFNYRCCKECHQLNTVVSLCNKIFYYTGLALITLGFFVDMGILSIIGIGCIFIGLLITFGIPALTKRYPNVPFAKAKEAGALVEI